MEEADGSSERTEAAVMGFSPMNHQQETYLRLEED